MNFFVRTYLSPLGEQLTCVYLDGYGDVTENSWLYDNYCAWLAEGNEPEPWQEESETK